MEGPVSDINSSVSKIKNRETARLSVSVSVIIKLTGEIEVDLLTDLIKYLMCF